jgi:hypothetical protein
MRNYTVQDFKQGKFEAITRDGCAVIVEEYKSTSPDCLRGHRADKWGGVMSWGRLGNWLPIVQGREADGFTKSRHDLFIKP